MVQNQIFRYTIHPKLNLNKGGGRR